MGTIIEKSDWGYKVCVVSGNGWHEKNYRPGTYTNRKDAIKALEYYGRGFVEANRHIITKHDVFSGGGTRFSTECKKIYE